MSATLFLNNPQPRFLTWYFFSFVVQTGLFARFLPTHSYQYHFISKTKSAHRAASSFVSYLIIVHCNGSIYRHWQDRSSNDFIFELLVRLLILLDLFSILRSSDELTFLKLTLECFFNYFYLLYHTSLFFSLCVDACIYSSFNSYLSLLSLFSFCLFYHVYGPTFMLLGRIITGMLLTYFHIVLVIRIWFLYVLLFCFCEFLISREHRDESNKGTSHNHILIVVCLTAKFSFE
jgi:hypothetical protein